LGFLALGVGFVVIFVRELGFGQNLMQNVEFNPYVVFPSKAIGNQQKGLTYIPQNFIY